MSSPAGLHQSGAMLRIYITEDDTPYVMLLQAAPIKMENGQWRGCQTIGTDLQQHPYMDIPSGTTTQFDSVTFCKTYFPWAGDGPDPNYVTKADFPALESGIDAALRETKEETHGVVTVYTIDYVWEVDGGYKRSDGIKSKTIVALNIESTTKKLLDPICAMFLKRNVHAFHDYNAWLEKNPETMESMKWKHRPECSSIHFVTWKSFANAIEISAVQLDKYEANKKQEPKGILCELVDHLGRANMAVIRSLPVVLLRNILDEVTKKLT